MATARNNKPAVQSEERVRNTDVVGDVDHLPRGTEDDAIRTQLDGTALTRAEHLKMIQDEFRQEALPSPPEIPGYHLCWLSSTSTYDPISKRMRLGYRPVMHEELLGFNAERMTSGALEGAVSCNEMVLFKIPTDIYNMIMQEFHHDQPMREEETLKRNLQRNETDSAGKELNEIEGYEDLAIRRPAPRAYA